VEEGDRDTPLLQFGRERTWPQGKHGYLPPTLCQGGRELHYLRLGAAAFQACNQECDPGPDVSSMLTRRQAHGRTPAVFSKKAA